jgi:hypothetical protein
MAGQRKVIDCAAFIRVTSIIRKWAQGDCLEQLGANSSLARALNYLRMQIRNK